MTVLTYVDRRTHESDDGWMTRCGVRAVEPADVNDLCVHLDCKRCHKAPALFSRKETP